MLQLTVKDLEMPFSPASTSSTITNETTWSFLSSTDDVETSDTPEQIKNIETETGMSSNQLKKKLYILYSL